MSQKMTPDDPAFWMLSDGVETVPTTFDEKCYICRDSEFSKMGLPLCYKCLVCGSHVPADDIVCNKGHMQPTCPEEDYEIRKEHGLEISKELKDYYDKHKILD